MIFEVDSGYSHTAVASDLNPIFFAHVTRIRFAFGRVNSQVALNQASFKCGTESDTYLIFLNATAV